MKFLKRMRSSTDEDESEKDPIIRNEGLTYDATVTGNPDDRCNSIDITRYDSFFCLVCPVHVSEEQCELHKAFCETVEDIGGVVVNFDIDEGDEEGYILVSLPDSLIFKAAEETNLYFPVKNTKVEEEQSPGIIDRFWDIFETDEEVDYISAPFRWDKKELFAGIEDPDTFFRSALRSYLTHHILIRTDVSKKKDTSDGINIRGLNYLKLKGVYTDVFILHDRPSTLHRRQAFKDKDDDSKVVDPRQELWNSWKEWYRFQPLWKIRNYFGEKIAFYFAWIGLYSESLILPTIFGIIVFFYGLSYQSENVTDAVNNSTEEAIDRVYTFFTVFNNPLTPWFALVICLWGTWFVEQWKRKSNSLKYEWDVSNFEQLEPDRPQFYGSKTRKNPITDEEEWFYPFYKLYLKLSFSAIMLLFMVTLVIASTIGIIVFRVASLNGGLLDRDDADRNSIATSLVSSVINATVIMILGFVYEKIAYLLTDWENHRTQTDYDDALIIKLFAFQFVNNYSSLFYIAFFKEGASQSGLFNNENWRDRCEFDYAGKKSCYPMLVMQVAILLIMKPMPKFFKDIVIPTLRHYVRIFYKRFKMGDKFCCCCSPCCCSCIRPEGLETLESANDKKKELIDIIEEDRRLAPGDNDFTLTEYTEKTIMYGMIVLFGTVFPLAPLIAIICNLVDIRVDAYRILWKNRRYIAQRAEDIGIWQYILEFLNMVGVVINSLIIAHTLNISNGSFLDNIEDRWLVAFGFEHVVFCVKFLIAYMIPDVPSDVQFKMRKEQFQVNRLFERGPTKKSGKSDNDTKV